MPLRRPHRKSRNGCVECKRRRVKCNEQQPCHNCLKYTSDCIYQTDLGREPECSSSRSQNATSTADGTASSSVIGAMEVLAGPSRADFSRPADLALQDLELMHHFSTSTARTLSHRDEIRDAWAISLPKEAYTCDYLMHGLLALSALHLASESGEIGRDYASSSTYHLQRSLARFREELANISAENCVPLFGMSSLMVIQVCAQSAMEKCLQTGMESSPSPLGKLVKVFNMCRGVETILSPYRDEIRQCSLRPLLHEDYNLVFDLSSGHLTDQASTEESQLARLADFIKNQALEATERTVYLDALSKSNTAFRFMMVANQPLEPGAAFIWPILMQRDFIHFMSQLAPATLVLTAYYCVILHSLDGYWFLRGWHQTLLVEITETLPSELHGWIRWPRTVCGLYVDA